MKAGLFLKRAPGSTKAACPQAVLASALALPASALVLPASALVLSASALALASAGPVHAQVPLTDGVNGMTCHFYAKTGRLRWDRPGGDWLDADGVAHGDKPFAVEQVVRRGGLRDVTLDLTDLAGAWRGNPNAGAVLLRTVDSGKNDIVRFLSSEHKDSSSHPKLAVEWGDGQRETFEVRADTYFACPTHKSLGRSNNFRVGGDRAAILVFPWTDRPGRDVTSAKLTLKTNKQYGRGASVGVFLPDPPMGEEPVRAGIAQGYEADAGIDAHPDVIFADRFEDQDWPSVWSGIGPNSSSQPVSADSPNRFEAIDGKALKVTVKEGERQGLNMHLRFAKLEDGEPEETYFRYYLRFGDSWNPVITGGKLPGLSGTYNRAGWGGRHADGTNGWSARGAFFEQNRDEPLFGDYRPIGSYLYHVKGGKYGSLLGWNLGPTGMLEKNRWYSIEQYVKLNRPGASDGVLRAWIDGKLVYEKTDVVYRTVPTLKIESVWMNVYHGGIDDAPADLSLFIDNVVVARQYIGPLGDSR